MYPLLTWTTNQPFCAAKRQIVDTSLAWFGGFGGSCPPMVKAWATDVRGIGRGARRGNIDIGLAVWILIFEELCFVCIITLEI